MLQKQLEFLRARDNERIIPATGRWLGFLVQEPQLAGLLTELVEETKRSLRELTSADHEVRELLLTSWKANEKLLRERLGDVSDRDELFVYGNWDQFATAVADRPPLKLPRRRTFDEDTTDTENLVLAIKHWTFWAISRTERSAQPVDEELALLRDRVSEATLAVQFNKRRLGLLFESMPGAAIDRIIATLREATPRPPRRDGNVDEDAGSEYGWEAALFEHVNKFAAKVHGRDARQKRTVEEDDVSAAASALVADAALVTNELQVRILAGRSRLALMRRYAAQCEGFDAGVLRQRILTARGKVEHELTLDFARFLFQQGLTPVLDGTIGGLRPDVLDASPSGLLYVEAKQYGNTSPRAKIVGAYRQVWSTWGRLANVHAVPEAFLLVFRVGGPRVELPAILRHGERKLYSLLVDLARTAGSREVAAPIALTGAELLPKE
jgi:hypothetical protein